MGMGKTGLVLCCVIASGASVADVKQWKDRDRDYRRDAAILVAEGREEAARARAVAGAEEYKRMIVLRKRQTISEMRLRESERDLRAAEAEVDRSVAARDLARAEKKLDPILASCEFGVAGQCEAAAGEYAAIFAARVASAAADVKKAEAEMALATFKYGSILYLVNANALDPAVLVEETSRRDARQAELETARKQLELTKKAAAKP